MVRRRWLLAPLLAALVTGCADPYQQDTPRADNSDSREAGARRRAPAAH